MGAGVCLPQLKRKQVHASSKLHEDECQNDTGKQQTESIFLRRHLLLSSNLDMGDTLGVLIYGPPHYSARRVAEFIAERLQLPILDWNNIVKKDISDAFINEISQNKYEKGFVLFDIPVQLSIILKLVTSISNSDKSTLILSLLCDNKTLYLSTQDNWDRWIHQPSGRSYHILTNPPQSFLIDNTLRDDITNEPLVQTDEDNLQAFKDLLKGYNMQNDLIASSFCTESTKNTYRVVDCRSNDMDTDLHIMQILIEKMKYIESSKKCNTINNKTESAYIIA